MLLGVVQGLTEFLPISSSAHLRIVPELLGWQEKDAGAAFTAVVQIGTEVAVVLYFWKDIWRIGKAWVLALVKPELRGTQDARMGWYVIIGSVPIVILGLVLKDVIETEFRNLWVIATMLVVLGLVLGAADRFSSDKRSLEDVRLKDAVLMGAAQAAALIPGVSRSGATISMGRGLGFNRETSARFAFLLAIPAVVGAGLFSLKDVGETNPYGWGPTIVATVVSFVVGLAVIHWLLRYVSTRSYAPFVYYRIALGLAVFALLGTGVLTA